MEDIFDLENLDDIPADIKDKLSGFDSQRKQRIIDLFMMNGGSLSVDEATVGYYREYTAKGKAGMMSRCAMFMCLRRMARGDYAVIEPVKGYRRVYKLKQTKLKRVK